MRAADSADGIHCHRDGNAPSNRNHDPAAVLAFRPVQHHVCYHPVTQKYQEHRPDRFSQQSLHDGTLEAMRPRSQEG